MATPLRWNMVLPNGQKLRFDMPGVRFGGTVEEVMAALNAQNNTMSTQNLVSGTLTDAQKTAIQGAVQTILANLPGAVDLSVQQRHDLVKAGDKSIAFLNRCRDLANQNPPWLPTTYPRQEFLNDLGYFEALGPEETLLRQALEKVSDTRLAAGSDAMVAGLILYGIAKAAGQGSALDDALAQMGGRFAHAAKAKTTPASKPTP
ncbi:MAG: hypothetical protein WCS42_15645 [Verrucomicrobiota bacterium]